jgi:hypothetical protein
VGIQTFNDEVGERIERRQNLKRVEANLTALRELPAVHVHADLIAGLPGEDMQSFARGFDRLVQLAPEEIQVGILKRLKGTPIIQHDQEFSMVYSAFPPFEILRTSTMSFNELTQIKNFARTYDLIANSGNFLETVPLFSREGSCFQRFLGLSEQMIALEGRVFSLPLSRWAELLFEYGTKSLKLERDALGNCLARDFARGGRTDLPACIEPYKVSKRPKTAVVRRALKRQDRRLKL